MGKLDEQLKELQRQKMKAELLKLLKGTIGDVTDAKFKEVEKEVKDEVFAFFDAHIDMIESGERVSLEETEKIAEDEFSPEQKSVLKKLADAALKRVPLNAPFDGPATDTSKTAEVGRNPAVTANTEMAKPDKISFALKHQKLGGRTVKIPSMGMASGTVTGIDAPYIVVRLVTGNYVSVVPEDLIA